MDATFTAYDKVPHTQYDTYQEYALLNPSTPEAAAVALDILSLREADDATDILRDLLIEIKQTSTCTNWDGTEIDLVPWEYNLFAILDTSGDNYNVYLLDEDSIFCGVALNVPAEDVADAGVNLMEAERARL